MAPRDKRKRGDARSYSHDEDFPNRQSPHRPQNLALANTHQQTNSPRGGRRGSRNSGRGGHNGPHSPSVAPSPTAMAPPANAYQASRPTQSTPTPASPALQKDQTPTQPDFKPDIPDINLYLTAERLHNWNAEHRSAVVQAATALQRDTNMEELSVVYYEINEACVKEYMKPSDLGLLARDILSAPCSDDIVDPISLFLDSLSTVASAEDKDPPYTLIRQMLMASEIDPYKLRSVLEDKMLIGLELVRPTFPKVAVRKATNALYRQTNYNLLREESEGFSKLMTAYFNTVNTEEPTREAVNAAYQRVNAFIGAFDLDVGRVLDVTLDVFANLNVKHCKFFIKYLRATSWWPKLQGTEGLEWEEPEVQTLPLWALPDAPTCEYSDEDLNEQYRLREDRDVKFWSRVADLGERDGIKAFFELGARRITGDSRNEKPHGEDGSKSSRKTPTQKWAEEWVATTGTLPPSGNDVAAQLLGFKLRFYASDARDPTDTLPDNFVNLLALLIKIGFISITDLYPHLYPADADMSAHREKLTKEMKEKEASRKGKSSNALATAGALSDDTLPAPAVTRLREAESKAPSRVESERSTPGKSEEGSKKIPLPEPVDQKVALLRNLLLIGAIPEALFFLGRFPWLLDVYPDLHSYIFRLAHHSLHKVYESSRPVPLDKIPSGPKGAGALANPSSFVPRRTLRWAKLEQKDAGDGTDYRFYWDDWMDNVPVCQSVDDVFLLCSSLLSLVGPECGRDILLMTKLARIGKRSVTDDPSVENLKRWSDLSTTFLAPALTFTGQNPGVVNEMWELFKRFDTATRYAMYTHWFSLSKPAVMRAAFKDVQDDTRNLLGKVATTNTRPMGRAMAKLAYSCPGTVFQQTLRQGQNYINMIDALVECSRYLTNLGYDCLTWTLVNTLVTNDKPTLQGDGMLVKGWLKNTAIFIGKVYRRFSLMDPTPVLQFVQHQLIRPEGEMYMLTVLEQLIDMMGGIGLKGSLNEGRTFALSVAPRLRSFILHVHLSDKRHEAKSPARRLLRCLKEAGLLPQILIALAQQVENYLYREELLQVPDKVVLTNFDHFRSNFAQYLEFLREYLSLDEFNEQIPGVVELMSDYGLEASLAFEICRDSLAVRVNSARTKLGSAGDAAKADVEMGGTETQAVSNGVDVKTHDIEMENDASSEPIKAKDNMGHPPIAQGSLSTGSNPEIDSISQQLQAAMPGQFGDHLFVDFFVTFWSLSLKDVYDVAGDELKEQYEEAKTHYTRKATAPDADGRYRHDAALVRQVKLDVNKLSDEYQEVSKRARIIQSGLQEEMTRWFSDIPTSQSQIMHDNVMQDCFLPRVRLSPLDAQFASAMLFFMHRSGVPGFRLLKFLDRLFMAERLSPLIVSMSEEEVKSFGRFLNEILKELQRWHENEKVFNKFAYGDNKLLRGFAMSADSESPLMTYEKFRHLHCKWHKELCKTLKDSLATKEYSEARNSIDILNIFGLGTAFPKIDVMAMDLRAQIEGFAKDDDRDDIKVAANSLLSKFKKNAKEWKTEAVFRGDKEPVKEVPKDTSTTTTPSLSTGRSTNTGAPKLSAAAPSFSPRTPDFNGLSKTVPGQSTRTGTEQRSADDRKPLVAPASTGFTPRVNGRDANMTKPLPPGPNHSSFAQQGPPRESTRGSQPSTSPSVPNKPEGRNASQGPGSNQPRHILPTRPDAQPARTRQQPPEWQSDRPAEFHAAHTRHDGRPSTPNEYGRSDRADGPLRDREPVVRRHRSRSPAREAGDNDRRERPMRDSRGYDDHAVRPLPRDARGSTVRTPYGDGPRDNRDLRDQQRDYRDREHMRERVDTRNDSRFEPRGPTHQNHPPTLDGRSRLHSSPLLTNNDMPMRREPPANAHHGDRTSGPLPPRPSMTSTSATNQVPINPERAALIHDDRVRNDPSRSSRDNRRDEPDSRRDRLSRPQSPRRDERPMAPAPYPSAEARRDYRDDRPPAHASMRDRREEPAGPPPTGPRSGREGQASSQVSRDMFQPLQGPAPRRHQNQDPNYGRLNQPAEPIPSGPRNPASDRRDSHIRQPAPRQPAPAPASAAALPSPNAPATTQAPSVHPSRLNNIHRGPPGPSGPQGPPGPPLQTEGLNAPSGPRSANRAPPTGPASAEPRNRNNPLKAINSHLLANDSQTAPSPTSEKPERRSGRERSRSPDRRGDGRGESRGEPRGEGRGEERVSREKRDRDSGRRDRDRERDRGDRERRDGRDERDRRGRGERVDEGRERSERKRPREPTDQPHGDSKRRR